MAVRNVVFSTCPAILPRAVRGRGYVSGREPQVAGWPRSLLKQSRIGARSEIAVDEALPSLGSMPHVPREDLPHDDPACTQVERAAKEAGVASSRARRNRMRAAGVGTMMAITISRSAEESA
jgi:hypothetical protein